MTPAYCQLMARYNTEMNRRFYAAAATLTEAQRQQPRGAFFGSLHGTLCHLAWADCIWLSRFTGSPPPGMSLAEGVAIRPDLAALQPLRQTLDAQIEAWAAGLDAAALAGDLTYLSAALGRPLTRPMALLATHLFNHQTHHRGQAHALLTAFGAATGDTDLIILEL